MIPYYRPYITKSEIKSVNRVLRSGNLAQGNEVQLFELEFAEACESKYAIMVNNATAALYLVCKFYKNHGLNKIDIPAYTFCATYQAALAAGLKINICDVYNDYEMVNRCNSLIEVIVAGNIDRVNKNYYQYYNATILDAAHCFPFKHNCDRVYSFYSTKPLNCGGEGGMIVTDNEELAEWCRLMRQHGRNHAIGHYENPASIGFNFKATEMAAAIGRVQLKKIDMLKNYRKGIINRYLEGLKYYDCYYGDHLFILRTQNENERIRIENNLIKNQIGYSRPYIPLASKEQCPNAWNLYGRSLSLPFFVGLTKGQQNYIIKAIRSA